MGVPLVDPAIEAPMVAEILRDPNWTWEQWDKVRTENPIIWKNVATFVGKKRDELGGFEPSDHIFSFTEMIMLCVCIYKLIDNQIEVNELNDMFNEGASSSG